MSKFRNSRPVRFFIDHFVTIALTVAIGISLVSVSVATSATHTANAATEKNTKLAKENHRLALAVAVVQREQLINEYKRAVAACASSTSLRQLLNDIDRLLKLADSTDADTLAVHRRLHQFTDTNPNCKNIPEVPQ